MRRLLIVSSLAVLLCVPVADAASVRRVEPAMVGNVNTDGKHSVAYSPQTGVMAVAHTDGDTVEAPLPAGCDLVDVARSTVLLGCDPAYPNASRGRIVPTLYDSDTGTSSSPPGLVPGQGILSADDGESSFRLVGLGTRWITGQVTSFHGGGGSNTVYQPRFGTDGLATAYLPPDEVDDLDTADHLRRLCAPLRVPSAPQADIAYEDPRAPFVYAKPWALTRDAKDHPILRHCGQTQARSVPCKLCTGVTLAGPWLAWGERRRLYVRNVRTGRTRQWSVPRDVHAVALTLDAVFVRSALPSKGPAYPSALYRAALR